MSNGMGCPKGRLAGPASWVEAWQAMVRLGPPGAREDSSIYLFPLGFQIDFQFKFK
jgi:hypothetical protein